MNVCWAVTETVGHREEFQQTAAFFPVSHLVHLVLLLSMVIAPPGADSLKCFRQVEGRPRVLLEPLFLTNYLPEIIHLLKRHICSGKFCSPAVPH